MCLHWTLFASVLYAAAQRTAAAASETADVPAAAVEVAELSSPLQVRSSHLASRTQVILLSKGTSAATVEWAVRWVSLRNFVVQQCGRMNLQSE